MLPLFLSFALPQIAVLVSNTVFFIGTVIAIHRSLKIAERARQATKARRHLAVYVRLTSLMGFTWVLGLLQNVLPYSAMRYAFITCNALQGVSIMATFICKSRVIHMVRGRAKGSNYVPNTNRTAESITKKGSIKQKAV